jgi:hypothetical protein
MPLQTFSRAFFYHQEGWVCWLNIEEVICDKTCYTMGRNSDRGANDDEKDVNDAACTAAIVLVRLG